MFRFVAVTADGDDLSAQFLIQAQDLPGGHGPIQSVPVRRSVDLNPLPVCDHDLQDLFDHRFQFFKGIDPCLVIPLEQIHMPQHRIIFIVLYQRQHLLIIPFVVFFLAPPPLEILGPELLVLYLMDRQDDKVKGIAGKKCFVLRDRMHLDAEFHPGADTDPAFILLFQNTDFFHIRRVVYICKGLCAPVEDRFPGIPVRLHAVIHMVRDTDLIHPHLQGISDHILHRI